jgi:hypothetical protein
LASVLWVGERLGDHRWPDPRRFLLEMLFLSVRSFSVVAGWVLGL